MGRCETCRFWQGREDMTPGLVGGLGSCGAIRDWAEYGDDRAPNGEKAVLSSYDGAGLWTRPDFGCVLHEPKGVAGE